MTLKHSLTALLLAIPLLAGASADPATPPPLPLEAWVDAEASVTLQWLAPVNVTVDHYSVYRNGTLLTNTTVTGYVDDPGLGAFVYQVTATVDGNESIPSNPVLVQTVEPIANTPRQVHIGGQVQLITGCGLTGSVVNPDNTPPVAVLVYWHCFPEPINDLPIQMP